MRTLLLIVALLVATSACGDTLHVAELIYTDVYIHEVSYIEDSVMDNFQDCGGYYVGQFTRSDSDSYYLTICDGYTLILPIQYDVVVVTEGCEPMDVNCDGVIDISDLWAMIDYMFLGGP